MKSLLVRQHAIASFILLIVLPFLAIAHDFHIKNGDVNSLIAAINAVNNNDHNKVINLTKNGCYRLKMVYSEDTGLPDHQLG